MSNNAARPLSPADRRLALGLFLLMAVTYGFFFGGGGWNQNAQFDLTRALVEQHSIRIDSYAGNTGDVSLSGGHLYANKAPGISLIGAIPYFAIHGLELIFGLDPDDPAVMNVNLYLLTFLVAGIGGALIPVLLFVYGRGHAGATRRLSLAVALISGLATPLFGFSTLFFAHVPSAALLMLSFVLCLRPSPRSRFSSGLAASLAGLSNYLAIPAAAVLGTFALVKDLQTLPFREAVRRSTFFVAGGVPGAVLLFLYQHAAFGGAFRTPIDTMDRRFVAPGHFLGILGRPSLEAFLGITVSPYRGILFLSPILLAALAGALVMLRRRRELPELMLVSTIGLIFVLFNISFNGWEGGFAIGPRYLLPAVPFAALLFYRGLTRWRPLWVVLATISFVMNFAATAVDPQPSGSIPDPIRQYILPLLITGQFSPATPITPPYSSQTIHGHVAVNPLTADQIVPFTKHPVDSSMTIWGSFNLGEFMTGAGSALSLVPILVWILAGVSILFLTAGRLDRLKSDSGSETASGF